MNEKADAGIPNSLSEEAAVWLFELKDNPHDQELIERFQNWRAQDPSHEAAWNRMRKAWRSLDGLAPEQLQASSSPTLAPESTPADPSAPAPAGASRRRLISGRRIMTMSAVALAACILVLLAPMWILRFQADHYTRTGEIRTVLLEDGSQVTLAGASAIKTLIDDEQRFVELLEGEAFFDVAHEPDRRFVVIASGLSVSVLGTEFNVRRGRETTDVALLTGSIDAYSARKPDQVVRLQRGQLLKLKHSDGSTALSEIDPNQIASWRHHKLFVSDQSVASVAEQIGRYQIGWVSIPSQELASKRVTGVYDLSNPERALRTLVAPFSGQVIEISDYLHILTRQ